MNPSKAREPESSVAEISSPEFAKSLVCKRFDKVYRRNFVTSIEELRKVFAGTAELSLPY